MILDYGIRVRLIGRTQTYSSSISRRTRRLNDYLLEMYVLSIERVAYSYNTCITYILVECKLGVLGMLAM